MMVGQSFYNYMTSKTCGPKGIGGVVLLCSRVKQVETLTDMDKRCLRRFSSFIVTVIAMTDAGLDLAIVVKAVGAVGQGHYHTSGECGTAAGRDGSAESARRKRERRRRRLGPAGRLVYLL